MGSLHGQTLDRVQMPVIDSPHRTVGPGDAADQLELLGGRGTQGAGDGAPRHQSGAGQRHERVLGKGRHGRCVALGSAGGDLLHDGGGQVSVGKLGCEYVGHARACTAKPTDRAWAMTSWA